MKCFNGMVTEELLDSFNLPIFIPAASEMNQVISRIEGFSIERTDKTYCPPGLSSVEEARMASLHIKGNNGRHSV